MSSILRTDSDTDSVEALLKHWSGEEGFEAKEPRLVDPGL